MMSFKQKEKAAPRRRAAFSEDPGGGLLLFLTDELLLVGLLVVVLRVGGPAAPADRALGDALGGQDELREVRLAAGEVPLVLQLSVLVRVDQAVRVDEPVAERVNDPGADDGLFVAGVHVGPDLEVEHSRDM